ncbi:MAG: glycosyltransferase [Bacteroidota bacterium]
MYGDSSCVKIAFLSTFYPFRGGIAQFNALVYRELEKKHEVKAFSFKRQYPDLLFPGKTQFVSPEDHADPVPAERVLDSINPFSYFKTAREIKAYNPDLVIARYWMSFFAPSLGFVLGKLKKPVRISILDNVIPHEKRFFDKAFNRYFLKRNDGFIVMSDKVLKDLLSIRPGAKYLRINHPVYNQFGVKTSREEAQRRLKLDPAKKTLLFFGIIRDYKGLDLLLDAFAQLDESYQLVVAGEVYGSFDKYEKQIAANPLKKQIHLFNQYISDDEVTLFFSAADTCILPYKSATQSGITSIANHFLLPLIATDVGGLKETIEDGKTGLIASRTDAGEIAGKITHYFDNDLKKSFSEAIETQNTENSWENFCARLLAFFEELKKAR